MKKLDFLILVGMLLFISFLFILFNNKKYVNNKLQLIVNNELIDNLNINESNIYLINSDDIYIYIYKNELLFKTVTNKYRKKIYNVITIENGTIKVTSSNCIGKDCMHMEINKNNNLPIICTNGIVIKISNSNKTSDIMIK